MSLDDRLLKVTTEVSPGCHLDVGTDHALLPLYLLNHQLCEKVIATEISPGPLHVAKQALWGRAADVRLGDGLEPVDKGEADSLSICGMGGSNAVEILEAAPSKVPPRVVIQVNRDSHKVRRWAREAGFHLLREQMTKGTWTYEILTFQKAGGEDRAYQGLDPELAFHFGPHLLKEKHPLLKEELQRRKAYHREHPRNQELQRIKAALEYLGDEG